MYRPASFEVEIIKKYKMTALENNNNSLRKYRIKNCVIYLTVALSIISSKFSVISL